MVAESEEQEEVSGKKLRSSGAGLIICGVQPLLGVYEMGKVDFKTRK